MRSFGLRCKAKGLLCLLQEQPLWVVLGWAQAQVFIPAGGEHPKLGT